MTGGPCPTGSAERGETPDVQGRAEPSVSGASVVWVSERPCPGDERVHRACDV